MSATKGPVAPIISEMLGECWLLDQHGKVVAIVQNAADLERMALCWNILHDLELAQLKALHQPVKDLSFIPAALKVSVIEAKS